MTVLNSLHHPKGTLRLSIFVVAVATMLAAGAEGNRGGTDKFAARLVISIVGAGEYDHDRSHDKNETVDGDKHTAAASGHLLQFLSGEDFRLPTQHIVITSDPGLKKWVQNLYKNDFKGEASLAGVVENAIPALDEMLSKDARNSVLNQALQRLSSHPICKQRMLTVGVGSILPLLKVDILVDGELSQASVDSLGAKNGDYGISSFKDLGTIGTDKRWQDDGTVIGPPMINRLMARLSGATVHAFITTCKAGLNGRTFDQAMRASKVHGFCFCATDELEDDFFSFVNSSSLSWMTPSRGAATEGRRIAYATWKEGADSLASVLPALMDRCALFVMAPHEQGVRDKLMPLFISDKISKLSTQDTYGFNEMNIFFKDFAETLVHRNRLYGFACTSADLLVSEVLTQIVAASNGFSSLAEKLLKAEYTEELPKVERRVPDTKPKSPGTSEAMQRITRYLEDNRRAYGTWYDENPRRALDVTVYEANFQAFKKAVDIEHPTPDYCACFAETLQSIYGKLLEERKQKGKSSLSDLERDLYDAYQAFVSHAGDITMSTQWPRMVKGEVPAKDFLDNMWKAKELFIALKEKWFEYVSEGKKNKATTATANAREKMMKHAATCFDAAYDSAREQVFTLLKKEALTTRLLKIEATAQLLATHPESMPGEKAEEALRELADKLQHITQDHVGPWMN